jgi:O-antigen/teichoic acid export membrane protein
MIKRIKAYLFENRGTRQRIIKNTFWLSVGQVGSRLIRAAILVYAARLIGAAEYGIFSYALSLAGFFTVFADLGISNILTREAAQKPEEKHIYFSTSLVIKTVLVVASAILVIIGGSYISKIPAATSLLPFVALLVIADGVRDFTAAYFRAEEKMEREAFITVITNVAIAACGLVILAYSHSARALIFTYAASAAFGTLAAIYLVKEEFVHLVSNFRPGLVRKIMGDAYPLTVLGILGMFMLNTDLIMIGWWRSATEIGWYAAGQRIIQILYTVPGIFSSATFPALSRAIGEGDNMKARKIMEYALAIVFAISIPIAAGGIILGKQIMLTLFGPEYAGGTLAFQLLLVSTVLTFSIAIHSNYVLGYNSQRKAIWAIGAGAVGNIVFNALLIPRWGIAGSSVSTIIAQILNVGLLWQLNKNVNYFETLPHLTKIFTATVIMAAAAFGLQYLNINVLANIAISGLIYAGILALLKEKLVKEVASIFGLRKPSL